MNKLPIKTFFETDYINYGSYDNYRKLACYIDGMKVSARKSIATVLKFNINSPIKVSQLTSKIAEYTQYLHGEGSLGGVIVGLAQDFTGANNISLLKREGNFGTRFVQEAAATRYIYTCKEKCLDKLFRPEDEAILDEQVFEGATIEPRFFLPTIPLLLCNGSEGLSTGFAQKILPRNPEEVKKCIIGILQGKVPRVNMTPWFKGFEGTVQKDPENPNASSWEIIGKIEKLNTTSIKITEVPIGYSLSQYLKILDDLEEKGIIVSYKDMSTDDKFLFEIKVQRKVTEEKDEYQLLNMLKLVKRVTENFTCCNENLAITEFKSIQEILKAYIDIKKTYLTKRKDYMLKKLKREIIFNHSKYLFIKGVVSNEIIINNKSYEHIEKQLITIPEIRKDDKGTYDYLLNMAMKSLTKEKYEELRAYINSLRDEYKNLEKKTIEEIWLDELNELKF
jgi:DNA topoisomerase-2